MRQSSLMEAAGWHTIVEMTEIIICTLMWKIINQKTPQNLFEKLNLNPASRKLEFTEPRLMFKEEEFLTWWPHWRQHHL